MTRHGLSPVSCVEFLLRLDAPFPRMTRKCFALLTELHCVANVELIELYVPVLTLSMMMPCADH